MCVQDADYNYNHAGERYSETADVTKQVEDAYGVINDILDIDAPEHDMLIADGKEWAQAREAAVEAQLIYEDKNMRVFDSNGVFCAASYYSPKQDALIPATVTYNEKTKTITLGFEDGGNLLTLALSQRQAQRWGLDFIRRRNKID